MAEPSFCEIGCDVGTDKCALGGKGHGYHPWYEAHFGPFRDKPVKLLEIGVYHGASMRLWERYFPSAQIVGVDVNGDCAVHASERCRVVIGHQADPKFLEGLAKDLGEVDIIVDDGGHMMDAQQVSFKALFPIVKPGGLYVIEDLETCYMPNYGGAAPGHPATTMAMLKTLLDDVQARYHNGARTSPGRIAGLHFYEGIAFVVRGKD